MIELGQLTALFGQVLNWLRQFKSATTEKDERLRRALYALYTAASETKHYVATLKRRHQSDHDRELALSKLWIAAAVELRAIDRELSQKCLINADYWADPTEWDHDSIDDTRNRLNQIIGESRKLLTTSQI